MTRISVFWISAIVLLCSVDILPSQAETGSCVIGREGVVTGCTEFTSDDGPLPQRFDQVCEMPGSKSMKWVAGPCPRENAIGYCSVPRKDGIKQKVYCYQKYREIPDEQARENCRRSCGSGAFTALDASPGDPKPPLPRKEPAKQPGKQSAPVPAPVSPPSQIASASDRQAAPLGTFDAAGTWNTSEGTMTLEQTGDQVAGRYESDKGEISGIMKGNVLEGFWIEDDSSQRCSSPKNGRYYWGRVRYTFSGETFVGQWGYCDGDLQGEWKGQRVGRPKPSSSRQGLEDASAKRR